MVEVSSPADGKTLSKEALSDTRMQPAFLALTAVICVGEAFSSCTGGFMVERFKLYDSDAHVLLSPRMWESLPAKYNFRRPRPVFMGEESELGRYNTGWFVDGTVL